MATADRILQLKLVSDVKGVQTGMKTVQKDMTRVQKSQAKVTSGFKGIGTALVGLGALSIGVDILKGGIDDFLEGEQAARNFALAIKGVSKDVPADMRRINDAMEWALTRNIDDAAFQDQVSDFVRRLRVDVPGGIRRAKVAINLAAAGLFPDATTAGNTLIKALDGSKKALDRLGVPMKARKNDATILAFLERKYGDAALDNANTLPGRWQQLQIRFGEFVGGMVAQGVQLSDEFSGTMTDAMGPNWVDTASGLLQSGLSTLGEKLAGGVVTVSSGADKIGAGIKGGITDPLGSIAGIVNSMLATVQRVIGSKEEPIRNVSEGIGQAIRQPIINQLGVIEEHANETLDHLTDALRIMKARVNAFSIPILGGLFGIGGPSFPRLAEGGIVNKPTLALIGEKGPEAVIPLSGPGAGGGMTITINTGVGDPVEIGRQVYKVLRAYQGRSGLAA